MHEAALTEFPFVDVLPRREKSKVAKLWDLVQDFKRASLSEGALFPVTVAAKALDVSRTRVDMWVADGRLKRIAIDGHVFITGDSMIELARTERKNGRPSRSILRTVPESALFKRS